MKSALLRLVRLLVDLFYRRVEVTGLDSAAPGAECDRLAGVFRRASDNRSA